MSLLQKKITMVVKDYSKLESYGFTKEADKCYRFYTGNFHKSGNPSWSIKINEEAKQERVINIYSHANITLQVICRMYADGVIDFIDNNTLEKRIAKKEEQIRKLEQEIAKLKEELK